MMGPAQKAMSRMMLVGKHRLSEERDCPDRRGGGVKRKINKQANLSKEEEKCP